MSRPTVGYALGGGDGGDGNGSGAERERLLGEFDGLGEELGLGGLTQPSSDDGPVSVESTKPSQPSEPKPKRKRGNLSTSPLSRPDEAIHLLAQQVQNFLYFPEPDPLYVVLGCLAANMLKGNPVWMVLIGAPSAGKGMVLDTISDIERVFTVGAFKGPGALLSGVAKKEVTKGATGGLLRQVGGHGMLVMKDFTSMLSQQDGGESVAALREIYDGRWSRPLGSDGGRVLEWQGKCGLLAASTPAIDRHSQMIGDLGERWVYYRYPNTDGYGETIRALGNKDPMAMMRELRERVGAFVAGLDLEWNLEGGSDRRDLSKKEMNRIYSIAAISTSIRSTVPRDTYTREVMDIAVKEGTARLGTVLGQMYLGLECIGLGEGERWRIVSKIGVDSAPQLRMAVVIAVREAISAGDRALTVSALRRLLCCGQRAVRETVESLELHGVLEAILDPSKNEKENEGAGIGWQLTDWAERNWVQAFGKLY